MTNSTSDYENYFHHLQKISFLGRIYKKFIVAPALYFCARRFGERIVEIGSGTGRGVLGTFPKDVHGLEINPIAVEYCQSVGLSVQLIEEDKAFPVADGEFDVCVLDNVLEHIEDARHTLDECYRITKAQGGLVIAVPGVCGYKFDADHKKFYDVRALHMLDERWALQQIFTTPFFFRTEILSKSIRQYCLVAIYKKVQA